MKTLHLFALGLLSAGCGRAGGEPVTCPLYASGGPSVATAGAWEVRLTVAQVALGPIYLCATEGASMNLCPVAVSEFAQVAVVDALDARPQRLGLIEGNAGHIGSVAYDFGISWFPRFKTAQVAKEAPFGHSAHFEGTAARGATVLSFVADVDVLPPYPGTRAVQGMRLGPREITDGSLRLEVRFDPGRLLSGVDFEELAGAMASPVVVPRASRAYSALVTGLTATAAPVFMWSSIPNESKGG